jgi:predicted RNase H-like HicB family nuclease
MPSPRYIVPDFRDPGTRGHALAQIREAPEVWAVDTEEEDFDDWSFRVWVWYRDVPHPRSSTHYGETLSEALLDARRAAEGPGS